jgi:hypothetical protein
MGLPVVVIARVAHDIVRPGRRGVVTACLASLVGWLAARFDKKTRCIARAFVRLVLKIQNLHVVVSLLKNYTIFLPYIILSFCSLS